MTVEVHAHARPVQPRRDLLDMGRLAGAVHPLHEHAAVAREARENRERDVRVEAVRVVDIGHVIVARAERGHHQVRVETEPFADRHHAVRLVRYPIHRVALLSLPVAQASMAPASILLTERCVPLPKMRAGLPAPAAPCGRPAGPFGTMAAVQFPERPTCCPRIRPRCAPSRCSNISSRPATPCRSPISRATSISRRPRCTGCSRRSKPAGS
ncbi:hypothetical protein F01_420628 [Burkholderia cenocepacia]|nr:hypothetical protein F01_420628 [Burkholderia cenocepacia]